MSEWSRAPAHAKVNLALVVGSPRDDGLHEVATVLQRLELADTVGLRPAAAVKVSGFADDTLVRHALEEVERATGATFEATIDKRVPVAAGLGGGSSDAATALRLANGLLAEPLPFDVLHEVAVSLGADVPFFLREGPCLGTGSGTTLRPLALPLDYAVLLVLPHDVRKASTADVYASFDERRGAAGFAERVSMLEQRLTRVGEPGDLGALPPNDLASSPLSATLRELGAFRADVSGAGPVLYGLFDEVDAARSAAAGLDRVGRTWVTRPVP